MGKHIHNWFLAEYKKSSLIKLGKTTLGMQGGSSLWVCVCGREKQVQLKPIKPKNIVK